MRVKQKRGDTLIEVMFSITIFALIAVIAVNLMNGGLYTAQKSLEVSMVRNEIDAQSEALRYIQNSFLSEKELKEENKQFTLLWHKLTNIDGNVVLTPSAISRDQENFDINNIGACREAYDDTNGQVHRYNSFVINTRLIQPGNSTKLSANRITLDEMIVGARTGDDGKLQPAELYPRILYSWLGSGNTVDAQSSWGDLKEMNDYRRVARAEGIWIIVVRGGANAENPQAEPEYFDFYIRTCWHSIGRSAPSTIGSIVRLYNPEVVD